VAAPSFVAVSAAVATATTATPAYPAGLAAGDLIVMFVSSNVAGIGSAPAGWTALGSPQTGGGTTVMAWTRTATGSETGTQTVNITSGTKGAAWMTAYRPVKGGTLTASSTYGSAATAAATVTVNGGSLTTLVDDLLVELSLLAAVSTFTTSTFNPILSQPGATMTTTARLSSRTGTNTLYFNQMSGEVTSGGTGAPSTTFTPAGSNGSGSVAYVLVRETVAAFNGSLALGGTGTLGATGKPAMAGATSLAGSGSLAVAGKPSAVGDMSRTGTGTLAISGSVATSGTLTLTSDGTLAAAGAPAATGTLTLAGLGALTVEGQPDTVGTLTLAGVGTLTIAGTAHGPATNITVTAALEPRRWTTLMPAPTKTATLQPRRWVGTL